MLSWRHFDDGPLYRVPANSARTRSGFRRTSPRRQKVPTTYIDGGQLDAADNHNSSRFNFFPKGRLIKHPRNPAVTMIFLKYFTRKTEISAVSCRLFLINRSSCFRSMTKRSKTRVYHWFIENLNITKNCRQILIAIRWPTADSLGFDDTNR